MEVDPVRTEVLQIDLTGLPNVIPTFTSDPRTGKSLQTDRFVLQQGTRNTNKLHRPLPNTPSSSPVPKTEFWGVGFGGETVKCLYTVFYYLLRAKIQNKRVQNI